jgi:hypothetical protein
MLRTYKATLRGNRLKWNSETPERLIKEQDVPVHVTLLEEPEAHAALRGDGISMAAALEHLAKLSVLENITDPVEWQREIRQERELLDRKK